MLPRLVRPASRFDPSLAQSLDEFAQALENGRSGAPVEQAENYRRTVVALVADLRGRLHPTDLRALIDTPGHDSLMVGVAANQHIVELAVSELSTRLRNTATEILEELRRWEDAGHALVVDTSVLLHHTTGSIAETDWRRLGGMGDRECTIVLPLAVLDEVDNQKRAGRQEVREIAREVIRELNRLLGEDPTAIRPMSDENPGLRITVLAPGLEHDPLPKADNEIIDQALQVHARLGSGRSTKLLTADIGMSTQARAMGLDCPLVIAN